MLLQNKILRDHECDKVIVNIINGCVCTTLIAIKYTSISCIQLFFYQMQQIEM